ncbi:hypothetical protein CsSME_00008745 [Camellia sinensis var. sinensis]
MGFSEMTDYSIAKPRYKHMDLQSDDLLRPRLAAKRRKLDRAKNDVGSHDLTKDMRNTRTP